MLGTHIIADFYDCKCQTLDDMEFIKKVMRQAVKEMDATYVDEKFYQFSPYGISGVIIISESHLTIHTYPEYDFCSIDIYTCSKKSSPILALHYLIKQFQPYTVSHQIIERGNIG